MHPGRKSTPLTIAQPPELDTEAVAADSAAATALGKQLAQIDALYGDGSPYERSAAIQKARYFLSQSAEALLLGGRQLILIKEHETHGDFFAALSQIGVPPRTAQKMMQAAVKYNGEKTRLVDKLNRGKLLELLAEDDEELAALTEGGTLAGYTLDEYERMSTSEMRAALKKERDARRAERETAEKLLADKNKKIDEYAKRHVGLPAQCKELQIDIAAASGQAIDAIQKLTRIRQAALNLMEDIDRDQSETVINAVGATHLQLLWQLQAWLTEEMDLSGLSFGGTKIQIHSRGESGPDLDADDIMALKNAGADEAIRVAGERVAEELAARRQARRKRADDTQDNG